MEWLVAIDAHKVLWYKYVNHLPGLDRYLNAGRNHLTWIEHQSVFSLS